MKFLQHWGKDGTFLPADIAHRIKAVHEDERRIWRIKQKMRPFLADINSHTARVDHHCCKHNIFCGRWRWSWFHSEKFYVVGRDFHEECYEFDEESYESDEE